MTGRLLMLLVPLLAIPAMVEAETVRVPVAREPVAAGSPLEPAMEMREIESGRVFAGTVKTMEEVQGMVAGRAIRAGVPIQRTQMKVDYPVQRNSAVSFVYSRGGVQLAGTGTSLDDGSVGETIRMLNPQTRTTVAATVVGEGQVEIR